MISARTSPPRTPRSAANLRLAASSVVAIASGYGHSLRPFEAWFSRPGCTIRTGADR